MDVYRDGQIVAVCDDCYRLKPTDEPGWSREFKGGMARASQEMRPGVVVEVEQARRAVDLCPSCLAGDAA